MAKVAKGIVGAGLVIFGTFTGNVGLVKFGYSLIISNALDLAAQALVSKPRAKNIGLTVEYAGTVEPRRIIYGELRVSGMNVIPPWTSGDQNKHLHQMLAIAGHQCNAITTLYLGETWIDLQASPYVITPVSGTANDGLAVSGTYANKLWFRPYLGTSSQTADFIIDTAFTQWTSSHRGRGVCYVALKYELDDNIYQTGKPDVQIIVQGKLCYDPRLDSSPGNDPTNPSYIAYTTNPALCLADYLIDSTLGIGEDASRIDWDLVVAAANICDEDVVVPPAASPSVTQKRYTCNCVLYVAVTDEDRRENLGVLSEAMLGHLVFRGGKWRMHAGAAASSTFALTDDDLAGGFEIRTETPSNEKYNYVRGQFVDAARKYQLSEFEPRSNSAYEFEDGGSTSPANYLRLPREVVFSACINQYEAQRNALVVLKRSRRKKQLTGTWSMAAYRIRPWDVGTITFDEVGWNAQSVRCISWNFNPEGTIEATFVEESSTDWDDPAVGDYTVPTIGSGPNQTGFVPDPVSAFTAVPAVDGIQFFWSLPDSDQVGTYRNIYEYEPGAASPDQIIFANATKIVSRSLAHGYFLPKEDTTTRYYWITSEDRFSGQESQEFPDGQGISGRALSITQGFRVTVNNQSHLKILIGTGSGTTTNTSTVTPIDNVGSVTYSWARISGDSRITAVAGSSATTGFQVTGMSDLEQISAVFRCTATDSDSPQGVATVDVTVTFWRDDSFGS